MRRSRLPAYAFSSDLSDHSQIPHDDQTLPYDDSSLSPSPPSSPHPPPFYHMPIAFLSSTRGIACVTCCGLLLLMIGCHRLLSASDSVRPTVFTKALGRGSYSRSWFASQHSHRKVKVVFADQNFTFGDVLEVEKGAFGWTFSVEGKPGYYSGDGGPGKAGTAVTAAGDKVQALPEGTRGETSAGTGGSEEGAGAGRSDDLTGGSDKTTSASSGSGDSGEFGQSSVDGVTAGDLSDQKVDKVVPADSVNDTNAVQGSEVSLSANGEATAAGETSGNLGPPPIGAAPASTGGRSGFVWWRWKLRERGREAATENGKAARRIARWGTAGRRAAGRRRPVRVTAGGSRTHGRSTSTRLRGGPHRADT
eukprot:TRINITY_DN24147_c0_g1_i1.p1 TRINITY_DN24147_c0_g1~~TRINITY_DN24147_c0_g1_i1.p1  ORF type:complete len:364 (+),score=56.17 TRINITY_DN24147_c0_g1_i1:250-1341(+)